MIENIDYTPPPTVYDMIVDDTSFVRGLLGPVGSGKSVGCVFALWATAGQQIPGPDGVKRYRCAIIRNSYRELQDTTIQTFFDWIPKEHGKWHASDMRFDYVTKDTKYEFLFRALDRPDDVKKLLSLELTQAWVNEAREIPMAVIDMLQARVGRYPSKRDGGAVNFGIVMDTNPPDTDSWWFRMFEEKRPEGWKLYRQPSGLDPDAENIPNLPDGYYKRIGAGKTEEWKRVYIHGRYGFIADGRPVYPEYNDTAHFDASVAYMGGDLVCGIDFGLTPAAAIYQVDRKDGQVQFIDEVVTEDMGAVRFGEELGRHLAEHYRGARIEYWGDPAGEGRSQVDERTPFDVLRAQGIDARPATATSGNPNDFTIRREAVAGRLSKLTLLGRPSMVIGPRCNILRKAMSGGYAYRRIQVAGDRFADKPDKNRFSHVAEAAQYAMIGGGYDGQVLQLPARGRQFKVKRRAVG